MRESRYNVWVEDGEVHHVYNGVSGRTAQVPAGQRAAVAAYLAGDDAAEVDAALLAALVTGRMIVTDETDEIELLRARYARTRRNPGAFHLTLVTSLGCNFACPYCFEAKHPSLMGAAVQERLLAVVDAKLPDVRQFSVLWFGGEPLVGRAALLNLSAEFRRRAHATGTHYSASIVTNGYLLTPDVARELRDAGVRSVQITVDGPRSVHDLRRHLAAGGATYDTILANLTAAADLMAVSLRVNLDAANVDRYGELLRDLADRGLAGRITVQPAQVVTPRANPRAPSATYPVRMLDRAAFAAVERMFSTHAEQLGFAAAGVPGPVGAPCTAVRDNELVVGSRGELYKCVETVGDPDEVVGDLFTLPRLGDRALRWLGYEPFDDPECRVCPALPVCMGGCAYHALDAGLHDSRCSTFRFTHREQVRNLVRRQAAYDIRRTHTPH
jgi:uncharacterized protein